MSVPALDVAAGLATRLGDTLAVGMVRLASATPEPAERIQTPPEELVTPGTVGFLVTFAVAVALVLLVRDMVRRNRRLALRAERRDARLREDGLDERGRAEPGPGASGLTRPEEPTTPGDGSGGPGDRPAGPNG